MTDFEIHQVTFTPDIVRNMGDVHEKFSDWPVVYTIDDDRRIYVGESQHVNKRMTQHLKAEDKAKLRTVRVVVDESFNRSVCHDLESTLIRWFSGDEKYAVINRNDGMTNANYYRRDDYRKTFEEIFEALREQGLFSRTIPQIENSDLFKLSPYKALNTEQSFAVESIMDGLVEDLEEKRTSLSVVQGDPGTGKTIIGIYLLKLLRDIAEFDGADDEDPDSLFSDYFVKDTRKLFAGLRIGILIPQGSLRSSVAKVMKKSPALRSVEVVNAFKVGDDADGWDILIVDEAHRLTQYAAQSSGPLNGRYKKISTALFGEPLDTSKNQLDWIRRKAKHTILLLDTAQSVRPADIEAEVFERTISEAKRESRWFPLMSQMRVAGGNDYIRFVRELLSDEPPVTVPDFGDYDFRIYTDLSAMLDAMRAREEEAKLARTVAGYAWDWRSKTDPTAMDINIGDIELRWNATNKDWINSPGAADEVGSIHTVQGYDLNYTGVIIGGDLARDPETDRLRADRENYRDPLGKVSNKLRQQTTTDDDLLR